MAAGSPTAFTGASLAMVRTNQSRPLEEHVAPPLQAAGRSHHTRRSYEMATGTCLQRLEDRHSEHIPAEWQPLAECATATHEGMTGRTTHRTEWAYGGMATVLALVTSGDLDDFRARREEQGDSPNTTSIRAYAVRTALAVALRDGIIPPEAGQALGAPALSRPPDARQEARRTPSDPGRGRATPRGGRSRHDQGRARSRPVGSDAVRRLARGRGGGFAAR